MNPLLIRRRGMMTKEAVPQDGQLEWIETDGVAYIDTGIKGTQPKGVRAKVLFPTNITNNITLIGCEGTTSEPDSNKFSPINFTINQFRLCFYYRYLYVSGSVDVSQHIADGKVIDVYCQLKTGSQVLGAKEEGAGSYVTYSKASTTNIQSVYNMYVFAINYANNPAQKCAAGTRLLELTIYSDFNMTTELIAYKPWRLNGEVGLMDVLTNTFYGNVAGSGSFTGGPNVI